MQAEEFLRCGAQHSPCSGSPYPKDKVPKMMFRAIMDDPTSKLLKTCFHCRQYQSKINNDYTDKHVNFHENSKKSNNGNPEFLYCSNKSHDNSSGSPHKRDKVPIDLFRKEPGNNKSELLTACHHCRQKKSKSNKTRIVKKKEVAQSNGKFYCTNCNHEKDLTERALNLDGSPSILCLICKDGERLRSVNLKKASEDIKLDFLKKYQSCCYKCNCVYLKPLPGTLHAFQAPTIEVDGKRCFQYFENWYRVEDILNNRPDLIEYDILELDHLTEQEQRERGLLKPDEPYIPKKKGIGKLSSKSAKKLESLKCQVVCGRCHVEETIDREIYDDILYTKSLVEREKLKYTWNLKLQGCCICGYKNDKLPRFFHFDHLDPSMKEECIARMVKDNIYSLEHLISEIAKCRIRIC